MADVLKEDSARAIGELEEMGLSVVMLTGDNEKTAAAVGRTAGVSEVVAGVLPDGKAQVVRGLKSRGKVAMVGDGVNDAPALTGADVGIAIGAGTDVAIDAADVVLMKSGLSDVTAAIRLSRAVLRKIKQNLFWAFFYNALLIPMAAGVFIPVLGWELDPMYGAAAMSLSSFCVVTNALLLNRVDLRKHRPHRKKSSPSPSAVDASVETLTVKVEGMMCEHCEKHVREALESLPFVALAEVSHEAGTAKLTLSGPPKQKQIKKAVENAGYGFIGTE